MLNFLRGLVFVCVIIHLSLLLVESSFFNGLFSFLGHTGLMFVHIDLLSFIMLAAFTAVGRQSLGSQSLDRLPLGAQSLDKQSFETQPLGAQPFGDLSFRNPWLIMAVVWCLYTAWAALCTLPSVHTIDRMCELILSPLTIAALFLCAPTILERRHYRAIFLLFSAILALHTLCVAWIMCTKEPMFFGQQVIDRTNGHPKILGRIHLPNTDGVFISANGIGSFLALFPAILLSEFMVSARQFKAPLAVTNAIICVGLLLSFCRAAQASVLIGFLWPAIVFLKKTPIRRVVVCAVILLLIVLACCPDRYQWVFIKSSIGAHAAGPDAIQNATAFVAHTVTTRRTEIWMAFLKYWQAQPLFGYGLLGIEYQGLGPHNFLLANLVYFGIPGLVLLVAMLSVAMKQILVRMRDHRELLVPIVGGLGAFIFVHGAAEYSITFPVYFANSVFWLLLGYACFTPLGEKAMRENIEQQPEA